MNFIKKTTRRLKQKKSPSVPWNAEKKSQLSQFELFSDEQMVIHGTSLALTHKIARSSERNGLLDRLCANEEFIAAACRQLAQAETPAEDRPRLTPAAEWLLDNYWLIEEQIKLARRHLPKKYSKELPLLLEGSSAGLPRVYDIALENIYHGDGKLDQAVLVKFVNAYQKASPLSLGELWAIPIMLRLALIENIRQVAEKIIADRNDAELAIKQATRLIESAEGGKRNVIVTVADMAKADLPSSSAFVAEIARRLQGQSSVMALPLSWLEDSLAESGGNIDKLVLHDAQQQASAQVTMSNCVGSLRLLSEIDWREFVESTSLVEQTLRKDPSGVYPKMDFASRDHYRHVIEGLARRYKMKEEQVAGAALSLADACFEPGFRKIDAEGPEGSESSERPEAMTDITGHVGFFLIDSGLGALKALLAKGSAKGPLAPDKKRYYRRRYSHERASLCAYLFSLAFLACLIALPFVWLLRGAGAGLPLLLPAALAALLTASQISQKLVNWLVTLMVPPNFIPKLDYADGIPAESRTLVVIPTLIGCPEDVHALMDKLEVHFLANQGTQIQFGVLSDFRDAPEETMPGDAEILQAARSGIARLNEKYPAPGADYFFLCHRPRLWNASEGVWMGFERKRGKICDFNRLLRGEGRERFTLVLGNTLEKPDLPPARYVITLDTDTLLPMDAAGKMTGAMAHPLNRPLLDPAKNRVASGYAIMQPRVGITLTSANRSHYARLLCGDVGMDPYTLNISDVYQDLFRHGSYIGKGIYDVGTFESVFEERFCDNRILSHDLLEGCYARSCLLTDVILYEDFPPSYLADVKRRHRWVRGDWQLLPWLLPKVPLRSGKKEPNPLSALSRWKIFDNLRRSLAPLALLAMFLLGWFWSPAPAAWTAALAALVFTMPVLGALQALSSRPRSVTLRKHLSLVGYAFWRDCATALLTLAWLPYEAAYNAGAALRTLWRLLVSKKHLMQWAPSSDTERTSAKTLPGVYAAMASSPLLALAAGAWLYFEGGLGPALPLLAAWAVSPLLAWALGRPIRPKAFKPNQEQEMFLRGLARKTWAFFEQLVRPEDNWLPPDNLQAQPKIMIAHRTSPTNMGLSLLAHLSAYDLGYLSAGRMLERLENSLTVMRGLERFQDHFYNWYDTRTLEPLPPKYVSSVDSGNLAGHLMVLRQGLLELPRAPLLGERLFRGLADTVAVLGELLEKNDLTRPEWRALSREVLQAQARQVRSLSRAHTLMREILSKAELAEAVCAPLVGSSASFWFTSLLEQCRDLEGELAVFAPGLDTEEALYDSGPPCLRDLAGLEEDCLPEACRERAVAVRTAARERLRRVENLAEACAELSRMNFRLLYDDRRELLSIGYNVNEQRLDRSYYDLLASEARLAYYVAIAQGQIPQKSWFTLGRLLAGTRRHPVLLSWSGSMFEYLMPVLVMPNYEDTLLGKTCRGAVKNQIGYGRKIRLPWGISECGYNLQDAAHNYQYRAFGVPGLGLKRGLAEDVVVAPYATALALLVEPRDACRNLRRLADLGLSGIFGMFEAVDYTSSRLPRGQDHAVVYSFMAHHQGMSLISLSHALLQQGSCGLMQRRFLRDPHFQAARLLLEERAPKAGAEAFNSAVQITDKAVDPAARSQENILRVFRNPDLAHPAVQLLSNGNYHVMVSSAGGGYSRCRERLLTRWREDATRDDWGAFCYLRDLGSGEFWSAAHQPCCRKTEAYEAVFSDARAEFKLRENGFESHLEIAVSPEEDVELRRLNIKNNAKTARDIEITSYAETVLAPLLSDAQHPVFSNLFVQTEIERDLQSIVSSRRPRSPEESRPYLFHTLAVHGAQVLGVSYETDRSAFIGRNRDLADPQAMHAAALTNTEGAVLDPIMSIRCALTLAPGESATLDFVYGVGGDKADCLGLIHKFRDKRLADRVFELSWTHSQILLQQFNADVYDAHLFERMAASIVYANPAARARQQILQANQRGQSGLWGQSISGDYPIVLLKISDSSNIEYAVSLVKAHAYWRQKGLKVDLVIWHEDHHSYRQNLQELILSVIPSVVEGNVMDAPGGIFVRSLQQLSREDRILLQSVARLIISDTGGTLAEQAYRRRAKTPLPPPCPAAGRGQERLAPPPALPSRKNADNGQPASKEALTFANGWGGFSEGGREYVIELGPADSTPAPWVNVIANARMGTVVSESGSAYTWAENAHEFRLTPWENDPVRDCSGEALYLRDESSGRYWSPSPWPRRGAGTYTARHGFGYSVFEHAEDGLSSSLTCFAAREEAVKFWLLEIRNQTGRSLELSATAYCEWVLGDLRFRNAPYVKTEHDRFFDCILASNPYCTDFPGRVAFLGASEGEHSFTCDRREFIGRNGTLRAPAALGRACLSGNSGAGLDPCAAVQTHFTLQDGETRELVFYLGAAGSKEEALAACKKFGASGAARSELRATRAYWEDRLGLIRVITPDPAVNFMANGWLLYQAAASRYLARSGFYQSGGAYGFRDQLQDVLCMLYAFPEEAREHLRRAAAHQFPEGDVLHWWHPPLGRGVRTRCSDDYLWLPFVAARYVAVTGDYSVLDEQIPYLEGRKLNPDEEAYYDLPMQSALSESLYAHCVRSIRHGLRTGVHGLPLMGSGDWNDGMDRVGVLGKGESVWLGFFLYLVLVRFKELALERQDADCAALCAAEAEKLRENLDAHAWDGSWYRRAYFDDGTPLGSAQNPECRIDSIAQSWAVLSGAAPDWRQKRAMDSIYAQLVRQDLGIVQLFAPPFDKSDLEPGYIKGYLPGVRENGGQYTHAAVWAAMAFAELGDAERAWELAGMICPINHAADETSAGVYKVEPYVLAADVYSLPEQAGRGGWSWYTGAAGWMYQLILESLLGLRVQSGRLRLEPLLPQAWSGAEIHWRYGASFYRIIISRTGAPGDPLLKLDGEAQPRNEAALVDDGREHRLELLLPGPEA